MKTKMFIGKIYRKLKKKYDKLTIIAECFLKFE